MAAAEEAQRQGVTCIPVLVCRGHSRGTLRYFGIPAGYVFAILVEDVLDLLTRLSREESTISSAWACGPAGLYATRGALSAVIFEKGGAGRVEGEHRARRKLPKLSQGIRGVSFSLTCDQPFLKDKDVAVVVRGNSALQKSEILLRYEERLTIIPDSGVFTAGDILQQRLRSDHQVAARYRSRVQAITGHNGVQAIDIEKRETGQPEQMPVNEVFVFICLLPNNDPRRGHLDLDEQGDVVTRPRLANELAGSLRGRGSVPGASAAGGAVAPLPVLEGLRQLTRASARA